MKKNLFTIIIPAHNEEKAIGRILDTVSEKYADISEIIVVNDGSTDHTAEIVSRNPKVRLINHKRNFGYGAAIKTGILEASTEIICMFDADGEHNSEDIQRLIDEIGDADMVVGSRGKAAYKGFIRAPGKLVLHMIANFLSGVKIPDLNCGLRAIKREILLRYLHLLPHNFSASTTTTLILLVRNYDLKFIPISIGKKIGRSHVRPLRDGFGTIMLMIRIIMLFNPLKLFVPLSSFFIILGLSYGTYKLFLGPKLGFPVGALLIVFIGVISFIFGLLSDQISAMRLERFEEIESLKQHIE